MRSMQVTHLCCWALYGFDGGCVRGKATKSVELVLVKRLVDVDGHGCVEGDAGTAGVHAKARVQPDACVLYRDINRHVQCGCKGWGVKGVRVDMRRWGVSCVFRVRTFEINQRVQVRRPTNADAAPTNAGARGEP